MIFTTSDAQVESAKCVTEEIQAKHFTPKGKYFLSLLFFVIALSVALPKGEATHPTVSRDRIVFPSRSAFLLYALLLYWVLTSFSPQERQLLPRFWQLVNGGTPRTIINCTSSRTLADISVQPIDFTGSMHFVEHRSVNN